MIRYQPKLDANGFDDLKLHITATEEASRNQGEAEDYGYRFTCPRPLRHTSPYFPRVGAIPQPLNPARIMVADQSRASPRSAKCGIWSAYQLWKQKIPKAGIWQ